MNLRTAAAAAGLLALLPGAATAQGYNLRLTGGIQGVSFRGYTADSIPVDSVVTTRRTAAWKHPPATR